MAKFVYQAFLTPEDGGCYSVEFPDLPGCFSCGDGYEDAVFMAADAAKTYVAEKMAHGEVPPRGRIDRPAPEGGIAVNVFFETDPSYVVEGDVVSAAEASRRLGVSPGRVTHMIDSGILDGYRDGRRTFVSVASIARRKEEGAHPGRPRKAAMA